MRLPHYNVVTVSDLSRTEACECFRGARINVPVLGKVSDVGVADKLFEILESSLVVSWIVVVFVPSVYLSKRARLSIRGEARHKVPNHVL